MVNYKDLGLVNTREMFKKAVAGGYAIPAFNFNTMEQMQAIVVHVTMLTLLFFAIWLKALWLMLRNWVAPTPKSCCTSTTVTASNSARTASIWASLQ